MKKCLTTNRGTHNSLNDIFICFRCFIQKYINQDIFKNEKFLKHKDNQNFISYYNKDIVPKFIKV